MKNAMNDIVGRRRTATLAAAAIALACAETAAATAQGGSAPSQGERIAFSCRAGARTVQVVVDSADAAYRATRRGGVEIQVPGGVQARRWYSGGGEIQVSFANGPWTYVVYERTVRTGFEGHNDTMFEAGVDVVRSGRTVRRIRCDDPESQFEREALKGVAEDEPVDH